MNFPQENFLKKYCGKSNYSRLINKYDCMENMQTTSDAPNDFFLQKWFLDCITDDGNAMIFYAAKLKWKRWEVPYSSWLSYNAKTGLTQKSSYRSVKLPEIKDDVISWNGKTFKVSGTWKALASSIHDRLYNSEEGNLDWKCYQPMSKVHLKVNDKEITGIGYAEELRLTIAPWKIPMNELRWGRYLSQENQLVWIELVGEKKQQWTWFNGEKIENVLIKDDTITIPSKDICLELDRRIELGAEKKILKVVKDLLNYIPDFNKAMTTNFLTADEFKWLSYAVLKKSGKIINSGWAIHEFIDFNPSKK